MSISPSQASSLTETEVYALRRLQRNIDGALNNYQGSGVFAYSVGKGFRQPFFDSLCKDYRRRGWHTGILIDADGRAIIQLRDNIEVLDEEAKLTADQIENRIRLYQNNVKTWFEYVMTKTKELFRKGKRR